MDAYSYISFPIYMFLFVFYGLSFQEQCKNSFLKAFELSPISKSVIVLNTWFLPLMKILIFCTFTNPILLFSIMQFHVLICDTIDMVMNKTVGFILKCYDVTETWGTNLQAKSWGDIDHKYFCIFYIDSLDNFLFSCIIN